MYRLFKCVRIFIFQVYWIILSIVGPLKSVKFQRESSIATSVVVAVEYVHLTSWLNFLTSYKSHFTEAAHVCNSSCAIKYTYPLLIFIKNENSLCYLCHVPVRTCYFSIKCLRLVQAAYTQTNVARSMKCTSWATVTLVSRIPVTFEACGLCLRCLCCVVLCRSCRPCDGLIPHQRSVSKFIQDLQFQC